MRFVKTARRSAPALAIAAIIGASGTAYADLASPDPQAGYMNWFELDCSTYVSGGGWGVSDLKASSTGGSVTLQPNFNVYNATDPYWTNADGSGAKCMEANLFEEIGTVPAGTGTYSWGGYVDANTLDSQYSAVAFIKILDSLGGYADVLGERAALEGGEFTVSGDLSAYEDDARYIMQVGFTVVGPNANPDDEEALGSVALRIGASTPPGVQEVPEGIPALPLWGLFGLAGLLGLMGYRRKLA